MKGRWGINAGSGQLRWVILLLAIAVVLPTVCLLWFISQAVKNERLAVRQKLATVYEEKLAEAGRKTDAAWLQSSKFLDEKKVKGHPYQTLLSIVGDKGYDGLIIYDAEGRRAYPLLRADKPEPIELAEEFNDAWELEFTEQELLQAIKLYEQKAQSDSEYVRLAAIIGKSRCLAKLGRGDEAIDECKKAAFSPLEEQGNSTTLVLIGNARLLMMNFMEPDAKHTALFEKTFRKLVSMVYTTNEAGVSLPADNNLFIAHKALEILREKPFLEDETRPVSTRIQKLAAAEERSIRIAEDFPRATALGDWQMDRVRRLWAGKEVVYGLCHKTSDETLLLLLSGEGIASSLSDYENTFRDTDVVYRILDDSGRLVAGVAKPEGEPFVTALVGEYFGGWKTELYFKDGDVFEKAASKQVALYTWAGALVIVLILVAGGFAGQVVSRQIKLNKMKNDFIATVSHELKTPLASMRVLVDTLLEGNYEDKQQATEYLQLTSKENERLSRLIDNFLTFSRMERSKQAFEMIQASPASIARRAAEAVKAKFSSGRCEFEVSIDEDLPNVSADQDAMVTVLLNLLDNAYKYSYDEKRIVLRVFAEDNLVCFQVIDNGVGLSRRAAKRIFNRFYQVDRSLSRSADGCGLGLSIVKFVVDAHKGSIAVNSKPGKGSAFTVKLPAGD